MIIKAFHFSEVEYSVALDQEDDNQSENVTYTQADLFKRPGMRKITIICMYQWFASSLVYYGLSLGAGSMGECRMYYSNCSIQKIEVWFKVGVFF